MSDSQQNVELGTSPLMLSFLSGSVPIFKGFPVESPAALRELIPAALKDYSPSSTELRGFQQTLALASQDASIRPDPDRPVHVLLQEAGILERIIHGAETRFRKKLGKRAPVGMVHIFPFDEFGLGHVLQIEREKVGAGQYKYYFGIYSIPNIDGHPTENRDLERAMADKLGVPRALRKVALNFSFADFDGSTDQQYALNVSSFLRPLLEDSRSLALRSFPDGSSGGSKEFPIVYQGQLDQAVSTVLEDWLYHPMGTCNLIVLPQQGIGGDALYGINVDYRAAGKVKINGTELIVEQPMRTPILEASLSAYPINDYAMQTGHPKPLSEDEAPGLRNFVRHLLNLYEPLIRK